MELILHMKSHIIASYWIKVVVKTLIMDKFILHSCLNNMYYEIFTDCQLRLMLKDQLLLHLLAIFPMKQFKIFEI